jgi:hypothetical protein
MLGCQHWECQVGSGRGGGGELKKGRGVSWID